MRAIQKLWKECFVYLAENTKKFWSYFKSVIVSKPDTQTLCDHSGIETEDDTQKSKIINIFFQSCLMVEDCTVIHALNHHIKGKMADTGVSKCQLDRKAI